MSGSSARVSTWPGRRRPPRPSTPATRAISHRRARNSSHPDDRQVRQHHRGGLGADQLSGAAERAHYLDAGVTQQIIPGLKVGLDGYYKRSLYHLDEGQFGAPTFLTPFNYHKASNIGIELSTSYTVGGFSAYGNLAAAQQVAKGIVSAQALFDVDDLNYIHDHYIVTDHSQLITASAGLAYLWRDTRISVDFLAGSGLRRTVVHPNDSTNPAYQQVDLGLTQRFTLPGIGKMQARFDVVNVQGQNYVLRDGTGVGIFAKQFGPPQGFYGGLKKEF